MFYFNDLDSVGFAISQFRISQIQQFGLGQIQQFGLGQIQQFGHSHQIQLPELRPIARSTPKIHNN